MIKIERNETGDIVGVLLHDEHIDHIVMMNCRVGNVHVGGCIVQSARIGFNLVETAPTLIANEVAPSSPQSEAVIDAPVHLGAS